VIKLENVHFSYGDRPVLEDINLQLTQRRIAIVGSNGCGKSTLVRLLNGLLKPTQGSIQVDGFDTLKAGRDVRRRVGIVFQNPDNQIVMPLVEEDLAFGLKNLKLPKAEIEQRIVEVLSRYDLLEYRKHNAHQLSGGQKQLIAIAGVLIMAPDYIVLDEPTTLLDIRNRRRVMAAIADFSQTAIMVSHDLDALQNFDRVIVLEKGRVIIDDEPSRGLQRYLDTMQ